jgi:hypothetical protein
MEMCFFLTPPFIELTGHLDPSTYVSDFCCRGFTRPSGDDSSERPADGGADIEFVLLGDGYRRTAVIVVPKPHAKIEIVHQLDLEFVVRS